MLKNFSDETKSVLAAEAKADNRALSKAAFAIYKDAKESIARSKEASDPGQPPHSRRGQIKRAIVYSVEKDVGIAVIGPRESIVGESGEAHEFGGEYKGGDYPERPFMGPALEKNKDRIAAFWTAEVHN